MAKVLIIDDDAGIREMLEDTLKLAKHEVDTAVDGRKAKELYDKNDYQVIITDIIMPGQDGFEVTLELRNRGMIDRVIAISGGGRTSAEDYLQTAKSFGVAAIFQKPIDRKALLAKISEIAAK
ncbi:MAG: response regulator [Fibrobacteraceae bacterium]